MNKVVIIILEIGLIDEVYLLENREVAEKKAIELANRWWKLPNNKEFTTFRDVEEFQSNYHTDSIEILIKDVIKETP